MYIEDRIKSLEDQISRLQTAVDGLSSTLDKSVERWTWDRYQRMEKNLLPVIDKAVERWTWERYQRVRSELLYREIDIKDIKENLAEIMSCTFGGGSSAFTEEYNLVVPIGPACRPAHQLKLHNLRKSAFPMDWMMDFSLDTVAHLLKTEFVDFFQEVAEDEERTKKLNPGLQKNRYVMDTKNKIVSIHHFPKNLSLADGQVAFQKTMMPRAKRMIDLLKKSERILFVCNRSETVEELETFLEKVHVLYPRAEVTLLNIRHNGDMEEGVSISVSQVDKDYAHIRDYTFNDTNEIGGISDYWKGSIKKWHEVLKYIALKRGME